KWKWNNAGTAIPHVWESITNRKGSNGKYYIIRVSKFRTWMESKFGKPDLDFRKKANDAFDRKQIVGTQGIIAFEIGFADATGHFDLWYLDKFSHELAAGKDYFALATRISLWTNGIRWTEAEV
ncbi:MAG: T6SS effector amidase Tae4 family protein, partial [Betaproteobacteria bacterium]